MFSVSGIVRRSGARALAISFLVAAVLVTGVAAKNQKSINGNVNETFTAGYCPAPEQNLICAVSSGSGQISHVGRVKSAFLAKIDPAILFRYGCAPVSSNGTLTTNNGDQLTVLDSGTICLPLNPGDPATVTGDFTITQGTGRFTGASGVGTYVAPSYFSPDFSSGSSAEVYTGSVTLPGCDSNQNQSSDSSQRDCGN